MLSYFPTKKVDIIQVLWDSPTGTTLLTIIPWLDEIDFLNIRGSLKIFSL